MAAPIKQHVAVTTVKNAEQLRNILHENGWRNSSYRLTKLPNGKIGIPLHTNAVHHVKDYVRNSRDEGHQIDIEIEEKPVFYSKTTLLKPPLEVIMEVIQTELGAEGITLTDKLKKDIPQSWEKHGDLMLFPNDSFSNIVWSKLGPTLWEKLAKSLGVVKFARKSAIKNNDFRSPCVELMYGEDGWVVHIDNGIKYTYDVTQCMFSSGNISEKLRVANFNCKGETVVDLYAGIGYFTLPYLVHAKADHVYACEWNPDAVDALRKNLVLNKVNNRCTVYEGDNAQVTEKLRGIADRINLGLIPSSEKGWPVACAILKSSGGIMHVHGNVISEATGINHDGSHLEFSGMQSGTGACDKQQGANAGEFEASQVSTDKYGLCSVNDMHKPVIDDIHERETCVQKEKNSCGTYKFSKQCQIRPEWSEWAKESAERIRRLLLDFQPYIKWSTKVIHVEHVKSYAPKIDHLVADIECRPDNSS